MSRLRELADNPTARRRDLTPLAGSDCLRLRVGDYRVLFSLDATQSVVTVELTRARGDIYKR